MNVAQWKKSLVKHPNRAFVNFFNSSISQEFRLGFNNPTFSLKSACQTLLLAYEHPEVVDEYLAAEIAQSRIAGPFKKLSNSEALISRFGVTPRSTNRGGD